MESVVWHLVGRSWEEILLCVIGNQVLALQDGEPFSFHGRSHHIVTLGPNADVGFEQTEGAPSNFGLVLEPDDSVQGANLYFCAKSKKALVGWKKALSKAISEAAESHAKASNPGSQSSIGSPKSVVCERAVETLAAEVEKMLTEGGTQQRMVGKATSSTPDNETVLSEIEPDREDSLPKSASDSALGPEARSEPGETVLASTPLLVPAQAPAPAPAPDHDATTLPFNVLSTSSSSVEITEEPDNKEASTTKTGSQDRDSPPLSEASGEPLADERSSVEQTSAHISSMSVLGGSGSSLVRSGTTATQEKEDDEKDKDGYEDKRVTSKEQSSMDIMVSSRPSKRNLVPKNILDESAASGFLGEVQNMVRVIDDDTERDSLEHTGTQNTTIDTYSIPTQRDEGRFTITVRFGELDLDVSFDKRDELDRVSMAELKHALSLKISKEEDRFIRPSDLELKMGDAVLREYWVGADVALRPGMVLAATETRFDREENPQANSSSSAVRRKLFSVNLTIGSDKVPVDIQEGDDADELAAKVALQLGLGPEQVVPIAWELHKVISKHHSAENKSLRNQIMELRKKMVTQRTELPAGSKSRDMFEALLDKAADRIKALEVEKKRLADQLFELRLVNAERLASSTSPYQS